MNAKTTPRLLALAAQALLTLIYARALDGLVGYWFLLAALLFAAGLGFVAGRSRLRLWVIALGAVAAFFAVRAVCLGVVGLVAVRSLDSQAAALLQRLDSGTVAAIPVLALGFTSALASVRRVGLLRWEPLVHGLLLLALLWSQAHYDLTYFNRAWAYVLVIGTLSLIDLLLLVDPPTLTRATLLRSLILALPLLVVVLLFSVRWYSTGGVEAGGGILRPTLFRFDFAPFVQLESEITMSEDLVLLYRRSGRPRRELIRRYVLSDYDPRRGFSVADDETPPRAADPADYLERELVSQEYFLINLDPGTRLALNEPIGFTRFENWDDSSFTAAFSARSMVSRAPPFRLARAGTDGLSASQIRALTDYGDNEPIRLLAEEVTAGLDGAFARARAIEAHLHDNYFYSLRPGIAADGDQLAHFLFESRKGYCSYYAFSMALMVRSLGIPARVAVGFFVDPGQEVLNFFPVLANMAHAWVEVYFGEYGWIAFDPTSQTLAPGEEYEFGAGADPNELASLLEEILARELIASPQAETVDEPANDSRLSQTVRSVLSRWYLVVPALYLVFVLVARVGPWTALLFVRDPRRRSILRVRLVLRWATACGIHRRRGESLRDFALRVRIDGMDALMNRYERALFAADLPSDHDARTRLDARRVRAGLRASVPGWRRVVGFLLPSLHRRVTTVALVFLFGLFGAGATFLSAQESAEWYREQSEEAVASERYDRAITILKEAQGRFDESDEFYVRLGDLYYDEDLFALALDEYLMAEARAPGSYEVLEQIAFTLGFLNRERESAEYWRRLVDLYPERVEPVGNLGWLLFKLHRLDEGVDLLLEAWDRLGPDADLAMTLGTLHAEQYRFAEARDWYRRSIDLASATESSSFVAVAFYNLSLIEKLFHRYEDALESTSRSLEVLPRPTGYLARGELHELRMDFSAAHADYLIAYDLDEDTPLARLNLALLYRRYGRLEEALAFAESVLNEPDSSWLYYYGTDVTRHRMELHDLLADVHDGLSVSTRSRLVSGPLSWVEKLWDIGRYAVLGWYHRARFRSYASVVGSELLEGGNAIDGNWHLYRANEARGRVAAAYLERARRLELERIPESAPFYAVEAARLRGDAAELAALSYALDSPWNRHLREEALVGAFAEGGALAEGGRRVGRAGLAAELFAINPGAFRQNGIRLPVRLSVAPELNAGRVRRLLARAGFDVVSESDGRSGSQSDAGSGAAPGSRTTSASGAIAELRLDTDGGQLLARLSLPGARVTADTRTTGPAPSASEIGELAAALFAVE